MSILVINPNSTARMTDSVQLAVSEVSSGPFTFFTAPSGPPSINNDNDCHASAEAVLTALLDVPTSHPSSLLNPTNTRAILVACYSAHPLVSELPRHFAGPVAGIFEASVAASLLILRPSEKFGIVTTGAVWEPLLTAGVAAYLGASGGGARFAGVATTGLSAVELHDTAPEEVKRRMVEATRRLVAKGNVGAVCLGCAGMVGMEEWVREGCVAELGAEAGVKVKIVDGVKAGVLLLESLLRL